jgi:hypothetical protein
VANAATPMRRPAKVSACSTTQTKRPMIAESDAPEASPEAVSQRYCRSTRRTILSVIQTRSRFCWRTPSIGFAEGNSILASPMRWATWQVFF